MLMERFAVAPDGECSRCLLWLGETMATYRFLSNEVVDWQDSLLVSLSVTCS